MAYSIVYNDFRNGQIDEQFGYRSDLGIYNSSAHELTNVVPFRAGGLTLREGTSVVKREVDAVRIIDFTLSTEESYYIWFELVPGVEPTSKTTTKIHICNKEAELLTFGEGPWETEEEIAEIQYAQDYEKLFLVQENHPPMVLVRRKDRTDTGEIVISWQFSPIVMYTHCDNMKIAVDSEDKPLLDDNGDYIFEELPYEYDGLFTTKDFPSTVTYAANRLIFANSKEHPYRIWVSAPFPYKFEKLVGDDKTRLNGFDFQTERYYKVVDESVTAEEYLKAIENYTSKMEYPALDSSGAEIVDDEGKPVERRITKNVSLAGFVTITQALYIHETGVLWKTEDVDNFFYNKPSYTWETVITDDCAMVLDIASNRDERIAWLAYVGDYIMVGTASSEWAMPSLITPTNAQITKIASYGSKVYGGCRNGATEVFYVQSGGRQIRGMMNNGEGFRFSELTFQCSSIVRQGGGVKELHWQRVPTPRLYCVLNDGTIAVLSYDSDYGINAWTKWTTQGKFLSLAIVDTDEGQLVYALTERTAEGTTYRNIEVFDENIYTDNDGASPIEARVVTNCIDAKSIAASAKKIYQLSVCAEKTRFVAGQEDLTLTMARNFNQRLVEIPNWTQPTKQGLRVVLQSLPREPFVIHSLMVELEVGV